MRFMEEEGMVQAKCRVLIQNLKGLRHHQDMVKEGHISDMDITIITMFAYSRHGDG